MSKPVNTFDNGSASHVFEPVAKNLIMFIWLVVLTCFNHLEKYESQWEGLSHILW
jgi:hypothetical protein